MDALATQYVDHLTAERKPANTVRRVRSVLAGIGNPGTATREEIEAWWAGRRDRAHTTRANDLAVLRQFYRWCQRWEHRTDDPTLRLDAPKVDRGLPRPMARADLHKLLDKLPPDLARAVALGAYAGLRVAEVAAINWADVDMSTRRARVLGKGNKWRVVALGAVLLDRIGPEVPGANIVTGTPKANNPNQLQRRVNRAIRAAGVDGTFHTLRHRYGTLAYQETRDLIAVGLQMGHSSPVTTAIYAAASDDMADRIAEAVAR